MAIIYSYPEKTSTIGTDQVLISDSQDDKKTKYVTMQTIADYIDGEVTLQEVLQTGSTATGSTGDTWSGNMTLSQSNVIGTTPRRFEIDLNGLAGGGSNKTAYLIGNLEIAGNAGSDDGDLNMSGSFEVVGNGTIAGNLNMSEATSDIIFSGGTITSTSGFGVQVRPSAGQNIELGTGAGGNITLSGSGTADLIANMGGIIDITSTGNATFSIGTKDYLLVDAAAGSTTLEGKDVLIHGRGATGSVINIGGTISNTRPDSIMSQAENIFQVKTTTGSSRFYTHGGSGVNTPGINSVSPHSFYNEIRLGGTAATFNDINGSVLTAGTAGDPGTAGQVMLSAGAGAPPEWSDQSDLAPSSVVQTVTNKSGAALNYGDIVSIDPTPPNQPQPDVILADNTTLLPAIGVVCDVSIPNNTEGKITKIGLIPDIDAAQFAGTTPTEGRIVYMAGGVDAGKMTVDRPTGATTGIQNVGIITRVNGGGANFDVQVVTIGRTNALPNNDANALFTTNASNLPISTTGKLEVDIANDTISIGDSALTTDVTITSDNFRAEIVNNTAAGVNNFVIGSSALSQAFANGGGGINNTALGVAAMSGNAASGGMDAAYNVAVGQNTLASGTGLTNTVLFNTAVGYRAMAGTGSGPTTYNTAIGANSLENINSSPAATFGDLNTAVGSSSLFNLTNGEENVAVGSSAGTGVTTGDYNTFVGVNSNSTTANMQLATSIGYNADVLADGGTALGSNAVVTGIGGVALGARAIAAANRLNIKVDNIAGPNPQGGLPNFADRAAALAAGLTPGDVYCATPGGPDNPGTSFLLAII